MAVKYGYPDGAEIFRSNITQLLTSSVFYNTYLTADLLKKYAVTVFFHSGYKCYRANQLGPGLKKGSPDMRSDFKIVDCTLVGDGRQHFRLLSVSCSDDFLNWLAMMIKNHKYNMDSKKGKY